MRKILSTAQRICVYGCYISYDSIEPSQPEIVSGFFRSYVSIF